MRKINSAFLSLIFLFAVQAAAIDNFCSLILKYSAFEIPKSIEIIGLTPGQSEIGEHIVEIKAETQPKSTLEVPVIAVRIKSGIYYILQDRHHTISAFALNHGFNAKVNLNVLEVHDFPLMSDHDYASMLKANQQMYFGSDSIDESWTFKDSWPNSIQDLKDNPLRSLIKLALNKIKISGRDFIPFYQFLLMDLVLNNGYVIRENISFSNKDIDHLISIILKNKSILNKFINMTVLKGQDKKNLVKKIKKFKDND